MISCLKLKSAVRVNAFTLTELLVVLVIIGILVLMSLPVLMPLISRTRSIEAKQGLKHIYTLEKTYFYEYARYSTDLERIGFEQDILVTDGEEGKANYAFQIVTANSKTFQARATAVVDFNGDGQLNIWEIDEKNNLVEVVKD